MNWSNIKNIMIGLLIVINVFLIGDMAVTKYKENALPEGIAESVERIFAKNGITVEEGLLPSFYEERKSLDISFYSIDTLAQMLLGGKVEYTSDGENIIAEKDGRILSVNGHSFSYKTPLTAVESGDRRIIKALSDAGLSNPGMKCENGSVGVEIDGFEIEGLYLDAALDSNGNIAFLSGVWGKLSIGEETEKATFVSAAPNVCKAIPSGSRIKNITGVYVIEGSGQNYTVKPAWKVEAGGKEYTVS